MEEEIEQNESEDIELTLIRALDSRAKEARERSEDLAKDKANKPYNPDQKGLMVREYLATRTRVNQAMLLDLLGAGV